MRLLLTDQFGELGGAQQCLVELMPALRERGWEVFAAVPGEGLLAERLEAQGARVTRLDAGTYRRGTKSLGDVARFALDLPRLAATIRRLCMRHDIGLLYVNGPRVLPAAVFGAGRRPVLFHAHSVPAGVSRQLVTWAARLPNVQVVAVSRFVAAGVGRGGNVSVVPNGVPDLLRPKRPRASSRIGILGRIAPEKGQLMFLEAARHLPDCRFVICGAAPSTEDGYGRRVREMAAGFQVEFLGWQDDIAAVLAELDVVVVPSQPGEGFGRTVIEAFSAMVPVVAFPSGGIIELIDDGRTGYLVMPPTPEALAVCVKSVLQDSVGSQRVCRSARADWLSKYKLEDYQEAIIGQILRAAEERTAARREE